MNWFLAGAFIGLWCWHNYTMHKFKQLIDELKRYIDEQPKQEAE